MLDGIQNNENYPSDFYIDLVFSEAKSSNLISPEKERVDKTWLQISKNCEEKRKIIEPAPIQTSAPTEIKKIEKIPEKIEDQKAFVIDSPDLEPQALETVKTLKKDEFSLDKSENIAIKENKPNLGELEKEAFKVQNELFEEQKISKKQEEKLIKSEKNEIPEIKKPEENIIKTEEKKLENVGNTEIKKIEELNKNEEKPKTDEKKSSEDDLDSYLSSVNDLIKKD